MFSHSLSPRATSLQLGGISSAVVGIGSAIVGPFIGAAADRYGQRVALLIAAVTHSAALVALAFIAYSEGFPDWAMLAVAFTVGATSPQTSPMSRSRLVLIIQNFLPPARRPKVMSQVLAYESAADEVVFVFGPVIVGVLATFFGPRTPILAAAALTILFIIAFAMHHTSAPAKSVAERAATLAPAAELARPSPARCCRRHRRSWPRVWFYADCADRVHAGSREAGGRRAVLRDHGHRLGDPRHLCLVLLPEVHAPLPLAGLSGVLVVAGEALLATASSTGQIALGLAITGIGIGPLLVTLYGLGTARSPEGRSATVMTMLGSGVILGQSLSSAVGGTIAENVGVAAALALPFLAAAFTMLAGVVNWLLTPSGSGRDV